MKYIIFGANDHAPTLAERDRVWSVLLFGERIQISTDYTTVFNIARDLKDYTDSQKIAVYRYFKDKVNTGVPWEVFEAEFEYIFKMRKKKMRTQLDNLNLQNKEKWFRL